jgi:hypothetical protein
LHRFSERKGERERGKMERKRERRGGKESREKERESIFELALFIQLTGKEKHGKFYMIGFSLYLMKPFDTVTVCVFTKQRIVMESKCNSL